MDIQNNNMSHMGPGMMDKPKSSKKMLLWVLLLVIVLVAAWLSIRGNSKPDDMMQQAPAQVFDTTTPQPTDPEVTKLGTQSSSDASIDIEKDLNNTSFDSISQ